MSTIYDRLFVGVFPTGLSFSDRTKEEHGDYKRLAFMPYNTLELQWRSKSVDNDLKAEIIRQADEMKAKRGQQFEVSACGQTVTLG